MELQVIQRLLRVTRQLTESQALGPLLHVVLGEALAWSGATDAHIVWMDDAPPGVSMRGFRAATQSVGDYSAMLARMKSDPILKQLGPVMVTQSDEVFGTLGFDAASAVLWAPFTQAGEFQGSLILVDPQLRPTKNELMLFGVFAEHAGAVLRKGLLIERLSARIRYLSDFDDVVTKLPNRVFFKRHLEEACRQTGGDQGLAVLFLDLDDFTQVNRALGHSFGDKFLFEAAQRLQRLVGASTLDAFTGCLGGDEFGVLLRLVDGGVPTPEAVARTVVEAFREPLEVLPHRYVITVSIGIALGAATKAEDAEALLVRAERAMYAAKNRGRGTFAFSR